VLPQVALYELTRFGQNAQGQLVRYYLAELAEYQKTLKGVFWRTAAPCLYVILSHRSIRVGGLMRFNDSVLCASFSRVILQRSSGKKHYCSPLLLELDDTMPAHSALVQRPGHETVIMFDSVMPM